MNRDATIPAILFLLSFLAALMPFEAYEAHCFLASVLLLAGAVVYSVLQRSEKPPALTAGNAALLVTGFAFWGLALVSVSLSEIPYVSYLYFCFFSALPLSFILALSAQHKEKFFNIIFCGLGAVFTALAVFSFAQHFFMPGWLHDGYVHWPLADPNSLAGLYSLAFFCALSFMLTAPSRAYSNLGLVLSVLFVGVIFLTGSKGALIALLAALGFFIVFARAHIAKHIRCASAFFVFSVALFGLLSAFTPEAGKSPFDAFKGADFVSNREAVWDSTWHIIADHFWTGTGIGTFFLYYPAYRGNDFYSAGFMAHNDPLQFWSEMGVLAPVLFYLFLLIALFLTFEKIKITPPDDKKRVCILAPFCALGAMILHSHINFHFNILPMLMASGIVLGTWHATMFGGPSKPSIIPMDLLKPAVFIALAGGAILFASLQTSEILTDKAREELLAGNIEAFSADVNTASRLSGEHNARTFILASSVPLSVLEGAKDTLSPDAKEKLYEQAYALLSKAHSLNPRLAAPYYSRAKLLETNPPSGGGGETPEGNLRSALQVDQLHLASRIALANILLKRGDKKGALEVLKEGMKWPNATPEYLQKTAFLALELGDAETHKTAMDKALRPVARNFAKSEEILRSGQKPE